MFSSRPNGARVNLMGRRRKIIMKVEIRARPHFCLPSLVHKESDASVTTVGRKNPVSNCSLLQCSHQHLFRPAQKWMFHQHMQSSKSTRTTRIFLLLFCLIDDETTQSFFSPLVCVPLDAAKPFGIAPKKNDLAIFLKTTIGIESNF